MVPPSWRFHAFRVKVEGLEPVFSFNNTELYLAMNLETSEEVMRKLRQGLETIRNNGMYEAIETKWGL